MPLMDTAYN